MNGWRNIAEKERNYKKMRTDRNVLRRLLHIKTWQLIIVLIIFSVITAMFLRLNNLNMMNLRDSLLEADRSGEISKVEVASRDLQNYVSDHINTSTGRIALQTLYNEAAQNALNSDKPPQIDSTVYTKAQQACMTQLNEYGYKAWAQCVANSVGINDVSSLDQGSSILPNPDAFYVDFASAKWSPDLAGILLAISMMLAFIIVVRIIFALILTVILQIRSRRSVRL